MRHGDALMERRQGTPHGDTARHERRHGDFFLGGDFLGGDLEVVGGDLEGGGEAGGFSKRVAEEPSGAWAN